jgi:hypothetical protein
MATIDPEVPSFAATKAMIEDLFIKFKLHYTLEKLEVQSITEDEAKVHFIQRTEKVSGPAFRNNRIDGIHTLKKTNGAWKIFSTQLNKLDYLDQ